MASAHGKRCDTGDGSLTWVCAACSTVSALADPRLHTPAGHAGHAGQSVGLPASAETGAPLSRWVVLGTGSLGHVAGHRRVGFCLHRAPPARPGDDQTLAVPFLDLHHRPRFPPRSGPRPGPPRPQLGRRADRRGRIRHQRGREGLHSGPLPLPPHARPGPGESDAGEPRLRTRRRAGLPGRLRGPPPGPAGRRPPRGSGRPASVRRRRPTSRRPLSSAPYRAPCTHRCSGAGRPSQSRCAGNRARMPCRMMSVIAHSSACRSSSPSICDQRYSVPR